MEDARGLSTERNQMNGMIMMTRSRGQFCAVVAGGSL